MFGGVIVLHHLARPLVRSGAVKPNGRVVRAEVSGPSEAVPRRIAARRGVTHVRTTAMMDA